MRGKLGEEAVGIGSGVGGGFCQELSREAKITDGLTAGGRTQNSVMCSQHDPTVAEFGAFLRRRCCDALVPGLGPST